MKMSRKITCCCVALFFVLTSVSAIQRLDSINDLKRINFGQSVPTHTLLLLYWFANTFDIDCYNEIVLNFDPNNTRVYGSHYYSNFEGLLDPLPRGSEYQYYSVGSLNQDTSSVQLPRYVVHPSPEYAGNNRDRIIIRAREQTTGLWRADEVYITQHIEDQREYDPASTYKITTNLLRQIREFSVGENQHLLTQLRSRYGSSANINNIISIWGNLAGLGLLLFIVIQESQSSSQFNNLWEFPHLSESNYRPEYNDRPQGNYTPKSNYRPENRHNNSEEGGFLRILVSIIVVVVALFFRENISQ